VKRGELEQRIARIAKDKGQTPVWSEGGNHSKVTVGRMTVSVPRRSEINEITARSILRQIEEA
jgi:hypothetical protein